MGYDFTSEIQPKHENFDFKAFSDVIFNMKGGVIVANKQDYIRYITLLNYNDATGDDEGYDFFWKDWQVSDYGGITPTADYDDNPVNWSWLVPYDSRATSGNNIVGNSYYCNGAMLCIKITATITTTNNGAHLYLNTRDKTACGCLPNYSFFTFKADETNGLYTSTSSRVNEYTFWHSWIWCAPSSADYGDDYATLNDCFDWLVANVRNINIIVDNEDWTERTPAYDWQSVSSIIGKNGILSLYELAQETDGDPVTGASSSVFFSMPEECNVKKLYPNIVYGQEQIIAYSGINELSVRWDSATSAFFRFTIYDQDGEYDWSYGYSFTLNNATDKLYIMLLIDVREDQTRLLRPSFVIKSALGGEYSYNLETISDENAERLYGWFVMNYEGVSIFGPPNEPAGGGGSLPLNDEPVGRPTLNNNRNAINTGFTRMYWLDDASALNDFASWMSDPDRIWDKIWETDPLQGIIEVALCPIFFFNRQDDFFHTTIKIFGQDTEIPAERLSSQFFRLECGTYTFKTQCGDTYLDYAPYTIIKVFLPYIGLVELNTNDVMKREIKLEYTFDILWGICIAHIYVKNDDDEWTLHYERHGQYLINIPITKADRGQEAAAIKQAITYIATGFGAAGGYSLAGGNVSDMTPNAAAGTGAGILGGTVSTALNVMSSHPQINYSDGSAGGLSGYMGIDEPYILIEHVITARPEHDELYSGMPCYITGDVGDFKNYNKFVDVHLEGIPCTSKEQDEIYKWLTNGVIIKTGSSTPDDEPVTESNCLLIFLKMTSEDNVIGKTFGNKKVLEGKLVYDTSIENPKFLVDGDIRGYNYVYIPIFSRFYYIDDIILRREMLQEISMRVDVLQSFKTQIRECSGIPMRSGDSDKINYYINDGAIIAQQNTRVFTQKFRKNAALFSFDKTGAGYLLTVADANLST